MDYHVLFSNDENTQASVIFHIPIPGGVNEAGLTWIAAVLQYRYGRGESEQGSALEGISPAEETAILAGELWEENHRVSFSSPTLTPAQRRDEIEAEYTVYKAQFLAEMQIILEWTGYESNVT